MSEQDFIDMIQAENTRLRELEAELWEALERYRNRQVDVIEKLDEKLEKIEAGVVGLQTENTRLREDLRFLQAEYGDSDEPMTGDALVLKERCQVLTERDRLREKLAAANRREGALIQTIKDLLMSADCSWEERNEGHDWLEACRAARKALEVPADGSM